MTPLAAPSTGSTTLSTWRVRMEPGASGPLHTVDREQVWTVLSGALAVTTGDRTETVRAGQTLVLPAGTERRVRTAGDAAPESDVVPAGAVPPDDTGVPDDAGAGGPVEALVAMPADGRVSTPDQGPRPLPWAV
ncbi:cupin domain-containing protein [Streptomyces sp. JJ36]|nr:cupin domain-containing protein [Streptomyces sp. JJ36]